jgi:hypothetical protein
VPNKNLRILAVDRIIRSTDQFLGVWSKNFDQVIRSSEIRSSDPLSIYCYMVQKFNTKWLIELFLLCYLFGNINFKNWLLHVLVSKSIGVSFYFCIIKRWNLNVISVDINELLHSLERNSGTSKQMVWSSFFNLIGWQTLPMWLSLVIVLHHQQMERWKMV